MASGDVSNPERKRGRIEPESGRFFVSFELVAAELAVVGRFRIAVAGREFDKAEEEDGGRRRIFPAVPGRLAVERESAVDDAALKGRKLSLVMSCTGRRSCVGGAWRFVHGARKGGCITVAPANPKAPADAGRVVRDSTSPRAADLALAENGRFLPGCKHSGAVTFDLGL